MNNIKKFLSANSVLLLVMMTMGLMICTSCSKDDDEPKNNDLVGTWYYYENGEIDYEDYITFRSNGTGTTFYYGDRIDFDYTYNSKTNIVHLNSEYGDTNRVEIEWVGKNKICIDGDEYYIRK